MSNVEELVAEIERLDKEMEEHLRKAANYSRWSRRFLYIATFVAFAGVIAASWNTELAKSFRAGFEVIYSKLFA